MPAVWVQGWERGLRFWSKRFERCERSMSIEGKGDALHQAERQKTPASPGLWCGERPEEMTHAEAGNQNLSNLGRSTMGQGPIKKWHFGISMARPCQFCQLIVLTHSGVSCTLIVPSTLPTSPTSEPPANTQCHPCEYLVINVGIPDYKCN